ncbi:POK18 protein, partial [Notiomystis cincta]|nr:POK18 protein [Notiomystis cincta]
SPTICQFIVHSAIQPVRQKYPFILMYHYTDDILIASDNSSLLCDCLAALKVTLTSRGLCVATEKIQTEPPWKYLDFKLLEATVTPQPVTLKTNINTLNDLQKLLGTINWIRPLLGVTVWTDELSPLFLLLKGDPDLSSPRQLIKTAQKALDTISDKI